MIKLNGEPREDLSGISVAELLRALGYRTEYIAVEINGAIIKKDKYDTTRLCDNDKVEVVNFVGGG